MRGKLPNAGGEIKIIIRNDDGDFHWKQRGPPLENIMTVFLTTVIVFISKCMISITNQNL
jgi:hypothetical protein